MVPELLPGGFARWLVVGAAWLCMSGAQAMSKSELAKLSALIGKPLSSVRSALLAAGWQPQETSLTTVRGTPERSWGEAATLFEAGYVEVERCTATARTYCFLNYTRSGKCLRVRTLGVLRAPDSEPTVHGISEACASKQKRE